MTLDVRTELIQLLPRLRRFAVSLTGTADQADDLVQTGIEKALRNLNTFIPGTRLDAWMFRILRNAWIDTIRARRDMTEFGSDLAETLVSEDGRITSEARLHLAEVQRAMADLPADQRIVLMLVCVDGMRYRDVAAALDIPEGTVMSRLSRARTALAARLKDKPERAQQKGYSR